VPQNTRGRATRTTTQKAKEAFAEQAMLEQRQLELRTQKLEELRKRFADHGSDGFGGVLSNEKRSLAECEAYATPATIPKHTGKGPPQVCIDMEAEALLVPYQGEIKVFHCKMIKNMSRNEHDGAHFFRVNFFIPGQGKAAEDFPRATENTAFVKELLLKSREKDMFDACLRDFKEVQKRLKDGQVKAQHRADARQAEATPLRPLQGAPAIRDISIKPYLRAAASRSIGNLEAHANAFRFSIRGSVEKLEIPYANIKTAIFQPAERGSLVTYLHLHLTEKKGIMVGKRLTTHVQFYTEVGNQTEDLSKRRAANAHDPDEIMEEQRQEELKQKINQAFRDFAVKVEKIKEFPLKFEIAQEGPMCFSGVPHKANVRLFCCEYSLVGVEDWPPLVIDMRDVEIVVFERATTVTREFDMALVMKNYNEPPVRITMIPANAMVTLKSWLADLDMIWYTVSLNMQWQAVMREVTSDIEHFLEEGGWQAWFQDSDEEEDDAAKDDGESDFSCKSEEDDDDDASGDIEEDSSGGEIEEEDEDDDEDSEQDEDFDDADDDEDSGKDWSELEREAELEERRGRKKPGGQAGGKGAGGGKGKGRGGAAKVAARAKR